ncbi:MAG TPA: cytochrome c oxidase subunit II, partial [Anaerolineae bacterium]|nr:cytochrome c oxidase subunit II [Anaerolineae bacterium]
MPDRGPSYPRPVPRGEPRSTLRRSLRSAVWLAGPAALTILLLASCDTRILSPAGPAANRIAGLAWLMIGLGAGVLLLVIALIVAAALRRRSAEEQGGRRITYRLVLWGGVVLPAVTVMVLMAVTINTLVAVLDPLERGELVVEVTAKMWWWEVVYPQQGFATANEIRMPVGQPVSIHLRSEDVIHSFWVPELHGKQDAMPDMMVPWWLQADRTGIFRGQCAEFCGLQHAKMQFLVVSHEAAEFEQWLAQQQQPAPEPETESQVQGREVFLSEGCAGCHAIYGTPAGGTIGPDLTHVAGRLELAAGTLPNSRGNLAAWIANPQQLKP